MKICAGCGKKGNWKAQGRTWSNGKSKPNWWCPKCDREYTKLAKEIEAAIRKGDI